MAVFLISVRLAANNFFASDEGGGADEVVVLCADEGLEVFEDFFSVG